MSTTMPVCACMGPPGDCFCIRQSRGLPQRITESYVSPAVWDSMTDDEKNTINNIKMTAALRSLFR